MTRLEVFDPAMCCPTGVCGPAVDPKLARFAADLAWLTSTLDTVGGLFVQLLKLAVPPPAFTAAAMPV